MALRIAHAEFTLSVDLIARLEQDVGAGTPDALVMRIDVGYVDDDATARKAAPSRRHEPVRLVRTVQPDPMFARPDLSVDDRAIGRVLDHSGGEAEHGDQEIVLRSDVGARQQRDDVDRSRAHGLIHASRIGPDRPMHRYRPWSAGHTMASW